MNRWSRRSRLRRPQLLTRVERTGKALDYWTVGLMRRRRNWDVRRVAYRRFRQCHLSRPEPGPDSLSAIIPRRGLRWLPRGNGAEGTEPGHERPVCNDQFR